MTKHYAVRVWEPGGPDQLVWSECPVAQPEGDELLIRHTYSGVNFVDTLWRSGAFPIEPGFVPGREGVGVVEAIGSRVVGYKPGDRVAYAPHLGSYSELRVIGEASVVRIPPEIDDRLACAAMLQGMTALALVRQAHCVRQGETVLVHAAAGGVGMLLCQLAAAAGARVLGTVSSQQKAELAQANGCHLPIVLSQAAFEDVVRAETGGEGVDVVFDSVGRDTFDRSLACIAPLGHIVSYGHASGPVPALDIGRLGHLGSLTLTRSTLQTYVRTPALLAELAQMLFDALRQEVLRPLVSQEFDLKDARLAHAALESRSTVGKILLKA